MHTQRASRLTIARSLRSSLISLCFRVVRLQAKTMQDLSKMLTARTCAACRCPRWSDRGSERRLCLHSREGSTCHERRSSNLVLDQRTKTCESMEICDEEATRTMEVCTRSILPFRESPCFAARATWQSGGGDRPNRAARQKLVLFILSPLVFGTAAHKLYGDAPPRATHRL